jgi:DNA-binding transcriptional ArsR family regulator
MDMQPFQASQVEMRILLALDRWPRTAEDLAAEVDLSPAVVSMYLRRLQGAHIVEVQEQRTLGHQVQNIYGLVPGSAVPVRGSGANAAKLLHFCSVLSDDIRLHMDDQAEAIPCTASLTMARIPSAYIPELMRRIRAFTEELEGLEDRESPSMVAIAVAMYPRTED